MPTDRVHRPHQQAQPRIRTPPHGQALHHWACTHIVEDLFMRLSPRPLIVAGIGVVSQGPEEGQTAVPVGDGRAWPGFEKTRRANHQHTRLHWCGGRRRDRRAWPRCRWASAGPGRGAGGRRRGLAGLRDDAPSEARSADGERAGRRPRVHQAARPDSTPRGARNTRGAASNAGDLSGLQATRSRPAPQGPGGSRIRPLGGSQRLFQRICVPAAPRRWQASTTRAAMPASADLPHVRGSYCFLMPTSPSILRTPS